jgi:hypothetical protein
MIGNFFQSLEDHGVEYLLISGQATVLYGAATFSEDIDLWIAPSAVNCRQFLAALHACRASFYKLTPPFEPEFLSRGHGFHFRLPGPAQASPVFLDVMGAPPRVGSFSVVRACARRMETDWGRLTVIGLKDLVELKKTQRLEDYPIISNLALAWFAQPECRSTPNDLSWALENLFTLSALRLFHEAHPQAVEMVVAPVPEKVVLLVQEFASGADPSEALENDVSSMLQERIAALQQADRRHWRTIIAELRQLRAVGRLMTEGGLV